jgi:hypothetical protein
MDYFRAKLHTEIKVMRAQNIYVRAWVPLAVIYAPTLTVKLTFSDRIKD